MPLSDDIETAASAPKQVTIDGNTAVAQSLTEQIKADQYLASKTATRNPKRGFAINKIKPPGAV